MPLHCKPPTNLEDLRRLTSTGDKRKCNSVSEFHMVDIRILPIVVLIHQVKVLHPQ
jgi:hypothetical protein